MNRERDLQRTGAFETTDRKRLSTGDDGAFRAGGTIPSFFFHRARLDAGRERAHVQGEAGDEAGGDTSDVGDVDRETARFERVLAFDDG